jgi:hypothetical protein
LQARLYRVRSTLDKRQVELLLDVLLGADLCAHNRTPYQRHRYETIMHRTASHDKATHEGADLLVRFNPHGLEYDEDGNVVTDCRGHAHQRSPATFTTADDYVGATYQHGMCTPSTCVRVLCRNRNFPFFCTTAERLFFSWVLDVTVAMALPAAHTASCVNNSPHERSEEKSALFESVSSSTRFFDSCS